LQIRICDFLLSFFFPNSLRPVCVFSLFDHFFCVSALRERNKAVEIVVVDFTQGKKVHGSSRKEWGGEGFAWWV
jgi:hypothetical protein